MTPTEEPVVMVGTYDSKEIYSLIMGDEIIPYVYEGGSKEGFLNRIAADYGERIFKETGRITFNFDNGRLGFVGLEWKTLGPIADADNFKKMVEKETAKHRLREVRSHMRSSTTGIQAISAEGGKK